MKLLDLSLGNPSFLQERWKSKSRVLENLDLSYKGARKGTQSLMENIQKLHQKYKNCKISDKTHIVITVGASQAVQACLYAQKKIKGGNKVFCPKPYWARFNDFFEMTGVQTTDIESADFIFRTSPNNPDGEHNQLFCHIRDACYNWPQYGVNPIKFDEEMVIFSLAKMSGHASTRIGWIITENEELAKMAQNYVNMATLGVSLESQIVASQIIEEVLNSDVIEKSQNFLTKRRLELAEIVFDKQLPISVISTQGMFWYVQVDGDFLEKRQIVGTKCSSDFYRLNLACSDEDFEDLKNRLLT